MNYTEQEWIDLMRSDPTNAGYMLLFADWLSENGRELEGEAIRLLGETGRVGMWLGKEAVANGYFGGESSGTVSDEAFLPAGWMSLWLWKYRTSDNFHPVTMRLELAVVYAERATPEQREDWQRELRGVEASA